MFNIKVKKGYQSCDIFTLVHFLMYMVLGMYMKNKYTIAFAMSILWEIFEYSATNNKLIRTLLIKYWFVPEELWVEKNIQNRINDVISNMAGYYVGNGIKPF